MIKRQKCITNLLPNYNKLINNELINGKIKNTKSIPENKYDVCGSMSDLAKQYGYRRKLTPEMVIGKPIKLDNCIVGHIVEVVDGSWYGTLDITTDELFKLF